MHCKLAPLLHAFQMGYTGAGQSCHVPALHLPFHRGIPRSRPFIALQGRCTNHAPTTMILPRSCPGMLLQLLEMIARAVVGCGPRAMFYLAAAVADFFLPWSEMVSGNLHQRGGREESGSHF